MLRHFSKSYPNVPIVNVIMTMLAYDLIDCWPYIRITAERRKYAGSCWVIGACGQRRMTERQCKYCIYVQYMNMLIEFSSLFRVLVLDVNVILLLPSKRFSIPPHSSLRK